MLVRHIPLLESIPCINLALGPLGLCGGLFCPVEVSCRLLTLPMLITGKKEPEKFTFICRAIQRIRD